MVQEQSELAKKIIYRTSRSRPTIGFLTHSISDAYGELLWKGVMAATSEAKVNLICFPGWAINDQRSFNTQATVIYDLISEDVLDGLVVSGTLGNFVGRQKLQQFCKRYSPLPMASIAVDLEDISSILVANHKGMFDLVTHLIEIHEMSRLAYISGPEGNDEATARYQGFIDALEKHHLPLHPHLVSPPTDWDETSGMKAMKVLLDERKLVPGKDFQAMVTSSDNVAYGALAVLWSRGISVPEDVVLTGFDAQERSKYLTPSLTTIRQPIFKQAYQATEMVLSQMRRGKTSDKIELPTELIVRESCGCQNEEIIRAKADTTDKLGEHPKIALAVSKETVLSKIAPVTAGFSRDTDKEQAKQLVQAFYEELKQAGKGTFLNILSNVFKRAELISEDVFAWQEVISILRKETLPFIDDKQVLFHAGDRCHQALLMIGERAQRIQGYRRIQAEERQATLDQINQGLLTTSDEKDLVNILVEALPRLNIPSCYISRYENPVVPTNGCHLILAYRDKRIELESGQDRFSSRKLVPPDLLPKDRPYNLVVESLYFRENQIGLAVFEAGPHEGIIYETLRGQLSGALWTARLGEYLRSLSEASSEIMSLREPREILQAMVERACQAAGAKGANVVILDKDGRQRRLATGGDLSSSTHSSILMGTVSMVSQVMQHNKPTLIENLREQASPAIQQITAHGIEAAGCFALRLRDKPIGAMWVYYEKTHHFPHAEVNALQLYVNQAAIAYDNAKRAKELEHLRQAAEKLATAADVQEVLHQIVKSARDVLEADSAVIWSYDMARKAFLPDELAADGVAPDVLEKYREDMPRPDGTAATVMQKGYVAISDVEDPKYNYLNLPAHRLRHAISVKSFQGIALQVEDETLGVLYVNHKQPKGFDEEDERTLKTFAYDAALALKKARLMERLRKGHEAARIVAEASVLKELKDILNAIAEGTQDALGCDAVSLYTYDEGNNEIGFPPAVIGVENTEAVLASGKVNENSLIHKVLKQENLHVASDAPSDPLMGGPFVVREGIKSSVSIPLQVGSSKVGVMFVNYRAPHHFTKEELADIELFAHQAAVAIRNAQLYDQTTKRAAYLEAFYEASKAFTGTLALDETLNRVVEQAWLFTGHLGEHARFANLAMVEGTKLRIKAAYPLRLLPELQARVPEIDLEKDIKVGVTGRAVKSGSSQLLPDVGSDPDYAEGDLKTHSELAVPIRIGNKVIGVINVEHPDVNVFDEDDQRTLEALASQAAIAIDNARLFRETEHRAVLLATAYEVARGATAILDIKDLLDQTVVLISERFGFYHTGIFLLDKGNGCVVLKAASSAGGQEMLKQGYWLKVGGVSIVSFVSQTGEARIALDVDKDDFYFDNPYLPATRSEIALPLQVHGQLIGVLDVQSKDAGAFNEDDKVVLQTMADQMAIAIQNAQQYEELKRTQGLVGARTALAWMGMASSAWRHTIDKHAISIKEQVDLLTKDLHGPIPVDKNPRLDERLSMIQRLAHQIEEKQITPPLSAEEGVVSLSVNGLIRERIKQLSENEPYRSVNFQLNLSLADAMTVRASPEWLRRALDILIDNGVDAMADTSYRGMAVETFQQDKKVMIRIRDNGKGIPEDVRSHLFRHPIEKRKGSKGLGMGLLMTQAIIQTYGGEIDVEATDPTGTTMLLCLPLED